MTCQVSTPTHLATGRDQKLSGHNQPPALIGLILLLMLLWAACIFPSSNAMAHSRALLPYTTNSTIYHDCIGKYYLMVKKGRHEKLMMAFFRMAQFTLSTATTRGLQNSIQVLWPPILHTNGTFAPLSSLVTTANYIGTRPLLSTLILI